MARTSVVGDTEIPREIASKSPKPLTRPDTVPQYRLGKSGTQFGPTNIPKPERTLGDPSIAPSRGPNITGGRTVGNNGTARAIIGAAKKFAPLIADAWNTPNNKQAAINLVDATESPLSNPGSFTPTPSFAPPNILGASGAQLSHNFPAVPTTIAAMKDGGFIRRRS